jgi:TrmH family RNA methyltransferase
MGAGCENPSAAAPAAMTHVERITSVRNPLVPRFRRAGEGDDTDVLLVEGAKLVEEAVVAGLAAMAVAVDDERLARSPRGEALVARLRAAGAPVWACAASVLARMSSVTTPQGIAAIFARPRASPDAVFPAAPPALAVIAAGIRDPGNLGAVIRTAEAAGATGLAALVGGADPFRDKAVRAAAGSTFRLPVIGPAEPAAVLDGARRGRARILLAEANGELDYASADLRGPVALVLGSEGAGIPEPLRAAAQGSIRVPMAAPVDSLNVAVAAGVLLFEARRQRRPT